MSGHLEEVEVMSGDTAPSMKKIDQLRANVETMTIVSELRRQLIGGICEEDVKMH